MLRATATVLSALLLAACGGGSDADSPRARLAADAGVDQAVDERSVVQLAGSSTNNEGAVIFSWEQVSGPGVTLSNTTAANPSFTAPLVAIGTTTAIELRLTATDAAGTVAADSVQVTVRSSDWLTYIDSGSASAGLFVFDAETRVTRKLAESIIRTPRIAPDASRIAYIDAAFDVWTVRPDGTERVRIGNSRIDYTSFINPNAGISTTDDVSWSPDGAHLLYSADRDLNVALEYYVARADGSREVQLEGASGTFAWSPDGSRLALAMVRPGEYPYQFYSVRPDGTGLANLSDAPVDRSVQFWGWSPDSAQVAYRMSLPGPDPPSFRDYALFTVRGDGTERTRVLDNLSVSKGQWLSPGYLLAEADPGRTGRVDLFTVRADGSALTKLNGPYADPGFISASPVSPNASRICFGTHRSGSGSSSPVDLYTVRPDGTGRVRLNDAPGATGCILSSVDGARIVYRGPSTPGGVNEYFSVQADGTGRVRLNADLPSGGQLHSIVPAPGLTHVVYIGEQETDNVSEGFVVRPDGTGRAKVNGVLGTGRRLDDVVRWSPDGSRFIYAEVQRYEGSDSIWEYFSVLPDATRVRLHSPTSRYTAQWSPDSSRLLYRVSEPSTGLGVLGISRPDGTEPVIVKEYGQSSGGVASFQWAP